MDAGGCGATLTTRVVAPERTGPGDRRNGARCMPWPLSMEWDAHTMVADLAFHGRGRPTMEGLPVSRLLRVWKVIHIAPACTHVRGRATTRVGVGRGCGSRPGGGDAGARAGGTRGACRGPRRAYRGGVGLAGDRAGLAGGGARSGRRAEESRDCGRGSEGLRQSGRDRARIAARERSVGRGRAGACFTKGVDALSTNI